MEKSQTWRTLFPDLQEPIVSSPRKKQLSNSHLESHIDSHYIAKPAMTPQKQARKFVDKNQLSKEHPLSASMYIPTPKLKTPSHTNNVSNDNPLNYKAKPPLKSTRIIKTKMTESKIAYLPASNVSKSPPRTVKTKNSETYFDFLPGSQYAKALPVRKPLTRILNKQAKCTNPDSIKSSCKKLKKDKLANSFCISTQFN